MTQALGAISERFCGKIPALSVCLIVLASCASDPSIPSNQSASITPTTTSVTIWTDSTELFFEYPAMIAGQTSEPWAVHVTRLADFSPITEGVLILAFRSPDGTVFTTRSQAPAQPGVFLPAPKLPVPGAYDLVVDIDGEQLKDRFGAGEIQVYASLADVPTDDVAGDAAIAFLKEQQWPIEFATEAASLREIRSSIEVNGEIEHAEGRVAEVTSPVSGLATVDGNTGAPVSGDRVRKGQSMISLSPTAQDDSFARAKADVERLNREVERLKKLVAAEATPENLLIEAEHDLDVARAGLEAMGASTEDGYLFSVRAPISGIVEERVFTPGARVEVGETLFRIVDLRRVWLELWLPARYASLAGTFKDAQFSVEGSPRRYQTSRIVSIGSTIDSENRTLPVVFEVDNPDESLKIGLLAQAQLYLEDVHSGVAIPTEAILLEDGLSVAYIQIAGESFERRILTLGPRDGDFTLVKEGIAEGEQVVSKGAYQVYLASLNTNAISDHGHPH